MRIDIMTLFPDTVGDMMNESILGRAQERGLIRIEAWQIRDYTTNKQNQVDDYPYGGGHGAVLQADPLYNCWQAICDEAGAPVHTIYMSPCGKTFTQADARRLREQVFQSRKAARQDQTHQIIRRQQRGSAGGPALAQTHEHGDQRAAENGQNQIDHASFTSLPVMCSGVNSNSSVFFAYCSISCSI